MSTTLLFDDPAWTYPGGSCRLRVWDNDTPGEGYTLAILTQDALTPDTITAGRSVTNAMADIFPAIEARWGIGTQIVQQTVYDDGHSEWEDVTEIGGAYRWYDADLDELAASIGISTTELAGAR